MELLSYRIDVLNKLGVKDTGFLGNYWGAGVQLFVSACEI